MDPSLWSVNGSLLGVNRKGESGNGVAISSDETTLSITDSKSTPEGVQWTRYQREAGHSRSMRVVRQDGSTCENENGTINVHLTDEDYVLLVKDKEIRLLFDNKGNHRMTLSTSTVIDHQYVKHLLGLSKNESIHLTNASNGFKILFPIYFDSVIDKQLLVVERDVFEICVFIDSGLFISHSDVLPRMTIFSLHNTKDICSTLRMLVNQFLSDIGLSASEIPGFNFVNPHNISKVIKLDESFVNSTKDNINKGKPSVRMVCEATEIYIDDVSVKIHSIELDHADDEFYRYVELSKKIGIKTSENNDQHLILCDQTNSDIKFPASWRFVESGKRYKSFLCVENELTEGVKKLIFENRILVPKSCWTLAKDDAIQLVALERNFILSEEPFSIRIEIAEYHCHSSILKKLKNIFGRNLTLNDYSIVCLNNTLPTYCTYTDFLKEATYSIKLNEKTVHISHVTSRFRPKQFSIPVGVTHQESLKLLRAYLGIPDKIRINKRAGGQAEISWKSAVHNDALVVTRAAKKIVVSGDRTWSGWEGKSTTITVAEGDETTDVWEKISDYFIIPKIAKDCGIEESDLYLNTADSSAPIRKLSYDGLLCGCEFFLCLPSKPISIVSSHHRSASMTILPNDDHSGVVKRIEASFCLPSKKIRLFGPYDSHQNCLSVLNSHPKQEHALRHGSLAYDDISLHSSWYIVYIPKHVFFINSVTGELSRPVIIFFNTSFPDILEDLCTAWSKSTIEPTVIRADGGEVELLNYFNVNPLITYTASWEPVQGLRSVKRSGR